MHFVRECTFRNHVCSQCHTTGHKDGFCSSAKRRLISKRPSRHNPPTQRQKTRADAIFKISNIDCYRYRRYATIKVDTHTINFQVDTASDVTVINKVTWNLMGKPKLEPHSLIAQSASGDQIRFHGQRKCTYSLKDVSAEGTFYVANTHHNLLGAEWISKMGLYSIMDALPTSDPCPTDPTITMSSVATSSDVADELQRRYPEAFSSDLGLYKHFEASLQLKPGAKPVFRPKRPVPYAAQEAVEKELDRLQLIGVISKVNYSNWAALL